MDEVLGGKLSKNAVIALCVVVLLVLFLAYYYRDTLKAKLSGTTTEAPAAEHARSGRK